jgi:FtsZ-interacting cell division protein ZipA
MEWVIVLIVIGAVILIGLLVFGGRRARGRKLEQRRVEAGELRTQSEEVAERARRREQASEREAEEARRREEAAKREAEQARVRQEAAEREASQAQADRQMADEQARRADEVDPDKDVDER